MAIIFNDNFTGSSIDTAKWTVYDRISDQVNSEVNCVTPANVVVSSGTMKMTGKFEDHSCSDTTTGAPNPRTMHYTSGQIAQATAPFLYGTVDVRAKIAGGTGLWPCIWMLGFEWQASQPYTANVVGADWPNGGWWEVDIAEFMNGHRTQVNNALHFITANRGSSGEKTLPFDATTRFMVYRLVWTPTSMNWYVDAEDGVGFRNTLSMTGTAGTDIPNTPAYLVINMAVGGFGGTPDSSTFPQTMEVDYARISDSGGMNIGYRTFNGTTDLVNVNIGNIASQSSLDCWVFAGRLLSNTADGEIIATSTYDPLDLYFAHSTAYPTPPGQLSLYDGVNDTGPGFTGLNWTTVDGFVILAMRRVASTVLRTSKAVYASGAWGSFTHSNGSVTFTNRTYPSSGVLRIANNVALNVDLALIARTTSSSDADINTLTTDLASWYALPNLTNLWRLDALGGASAVNDIKGTATQNAITGTTLVSNAFPILDNLSITSSTVSPRLILPRGAAARASSW